MTQHILVVPVTGLLEVITVTGDPHDPVGYIPTREGELVVLRLHVGDKHRGTVRWFHHPNAPANSRAQEVLLSLTGAYVVLTGDVVFTDMTRDRIYRQVAKLSARDETAVDGRSE